MDATEPTIQVQAPYTACACLRCDHHWKARNIHARPSSCPRCGSGLWDRPPLRRTARRPDDPPNPNWKYRHKPIKRKCPTCHRPWTRLTVAERKELEAKAAAQTPAPAPAHVGVVTDHKPGPFQESVLRGDRPPGPSVIPRKMTPPPGMRGPTPPPQRAQFAETPEVQASRRSLSDELKENS